MRVSIAKHSAIFLIEKYYGLVQVSYVSNLAVDQPNKISYSTVDNTDAEEPREMTNHARQKINDNRYSDPYRAG